MVVIAAIGLVFLFLIPGSAFAYWIPDSYGPGLPGPQGGYLGDNPGPSLPWLGNILSDIFGNPGYPYVPWRQNMERGFKSDSSNLMLV